MSVGIQTQGKMRMFPEDCLQSIIKPSEWWVKNEDNTLCRGALAFAFAPHVDQMPYQFEPVGRTDPLSHGTANLKVSPLKIDQPLKRVSLPVAAMTQNPGEVWAAYRAKRRPCLVIGSSNPTVDKNLTKGKPNHATAPTILMAPYYGADENGQRAGYSEPFRERVRHCEYPQFVWDCLPIPTGPTESILRLDHIQPIGTNYNSYKLSSYKLSEEALDIIDEQINWLLYSGVPEDSLIAMYREEIESTFGT